MRIMWVFKLSFGLHRIEMGYNAALHAQGDRQFLKYLNTPEALKGRMADFSDDDRKKVEAKAEELFSSIKLKFKTKRDER